jgi:hypothetical protein
MFWFPFSSALLLVPHSSSSIMYWAHPWEITTSSLALWQGNCTRQWFSYKPWTSVIPCHVSPLFLRVNKFNWHSLFCKGCNFAVYYMSGVHHTTNNK